MESIIITPEKAQKTIWNIIWGLAFVLGLVLWVIINIFGEEIIIDIIGLGYLIMMVLIFLYLPALFKSLIYSIESDSIKMHVGVFWKKQVTVPYAKITNLDVTQGPVERLFNVGVIHIQTAGAGGSQGGQAELKLIGIRDTNKLKMSIMKLVTESRLPNFVQPESEQDRSSENNELGQILKELKTIRELLEGKHL